MDGQDGAMPVTCPIARETGAPAGHDLSKAAYHKDLDDVIDSIEQSYQEVL